MALVGIQWISNSRILRSSTLHTYHSFLTNHRRNSAEIDPKTRQLIQKHFRSQMADQICYAVLCVFSYVAAGQNKASLEASQQQQHQQQQAQVPGSTTKVETAAGS